MIKTKIKSVYIELQTPQMMLDCVRAYYQKYTIAFRNGNIVYVQTPFLVNRVWQRAYFAPNRVYSLNFTFDKRFSLLLQNIIESDNN